MATAIPRFALWIEDNGIGFEEEYRERIFQVFQRLHNSTDYAGAGIGLAICRRIAERHGGTIRAYGRPGEGASFVVNLPLRQDEIAQTRHGEAHGQAGLASSRANNQENKQANNQANDQMSVHKAESATKEPAGEIFGMGRQGPQPESERGI
jgi:hypothetical protein